MRDRWLRFLITVATISTFSLPAVAYVLPAEIRLRDKADWELVAHGTPPRPNEAAIPCGDIGVYSIVPPSNDFAVHRRKGAFTLQVAAIANGTEKPLLYPPGSNASIPFSVTANGTPTWIPCPNKTCFAFAPSNTRDWVAVIDWDEVHGWSVGALIRQVLPNDIDIVLYELDPADPRWQPYSALATSDLHVLEQLCEIAETVDGGAIPAPVVINMSFGREDRPPSASALDDEIDRLIAHLAKPTQRRNGSLFVAAAGNHREMLFPAVNPYVVAVGSLDHRKFDRGIVGPTWESPQDYSGRSAALLPGSGLCLSDSTATAHWPAPPGSSYSAALFSGGVASLIADDLVGDLTGKSFWYPIPTSVSNGVTLFEIGRDGGRVGKTRGAFEAFLSDTLSESDSPCSAGSSPTPPATTFRLGPPQGTTTLPWPSFIEILPAAFKTPTPDSDPCVPCSASQRPNSAIAARASIDAIAPWIEVDLQNANPLPSAGSIVALYLRLGNRLHRLVGDGNTFSSLANGQLNEFRIDLTGISAQSYTEQPSLLFVVSTDELPSVPYWTSIPIVMTKR